ncbi:SDR family NAD(P)-dependent oxidoreductase [Lactiplantibacillus paraxiangfangensis]|uniref:SDR family NAD(P)-dependent oxidoreductase n=1 Tax=Lactiplantibacillus paraxiangfangensis TaxID=3076224 RepID=UPI0030C6BCAB
MKIFITGSSTGLGALTAKRLLAQGHEVVLHARNAQRAQAALEFNPQASHVVIGDLADVDAVKMMAKQVNQLGPFDVIIHNAGVYTNDYAQTLAVNLVAPYLLTNLITLPKRLIYVSSGMHIGATIDLLTLKKLTYSASKLAILMLAKAVAQKHPEVIVNSVDPGWVPTRMGGAGADDSLADGYQSQVWLASGQDQAALTSGHYYYHRQLAKYDERVDDPNQRKQLIETLAHQTGVKLQ